MLAKLHLAAKVPELAHVVKHASQDWRGALEHLGQQVRYYRALYQDARTPKRAKFLIGAGLAYFFSPIDLVPDFIPVIGQLDDAVIVPLLFKLGARLVPEELKNELRKKHLGS